jgi:hypothetical protein
VDVHVPVVLGPHGLQVVLLEPKKQRLRQLDEPVLVYEYLVGCEALVTDSAAVESLESSAPAVQNAPQVTFLEGQVLAALGPFLDLLSCVFEGVFEHQVHFELDRADVVLPLLLDLDQRQEVVVLDLRSALEEGFQALEIGLTGASDYSHQVVPVVDPAPQKCVSVVLHFVDLKFVLYPLVGIRLPHQRPYKLYQ